MRKLLAGFCALFLAAPFVSAEPPPPLEAYGALPFFTDAELSPSGDRIAVVANSNANSWLIIMTRAGELLRQLGIETIRAREVAFYDEDHVIALVSATARPFGMRHRNEFSGAFSIGVLGGNPVPLLSRVRNLYPSQTGLGRIVGRGDAPGTVLMPAYIGNLASVPNNHLIQVSLETGGGSTKHRGTNDTIDWFTDGKGEVIARERYNNENNQYQVQIRDGGWKTIFELKDAKTMPFSITGVMPDGSGLVFVYTNDEENFSGLMVLGFDGQISGPILNHPNRDIDMIYKDDERRVLGVRYSGMRPTYEFLDPELGASFKEVSASIPDGFIQLDSWSQDRKFVLYFVFAPAYGEAWIVHDVANKKIERIATSRDQIPLGQVSFPLGIEYSARDGLRIPAVLTLPPGVEVEEKVKRPLIILPHGGPASYDSANFDWMAQFLASRGYVVLQPNFRGSSGYGMAFQTAGNGEWGGKMQDDLADGITALNSLGIIDPEKVCIVGASYGGYAALAGAALTPDVYRCSVAVAGVSDLNDMVLYTRSNYGNDHWAVAYWRRVIADGDTRAKRMREVSPINFADQVKIPILMVHGEDDTVVPIAQSEKMQRALKKYGKDVTLVRLKGEDHWLSGSETRIEMLRALDAFLAKHLPVSASTTP
ncbi:alpha/beta hydrolase family protein [Hyphomonas sp. NPDC076900]